MELKKKTKEEWERSFRKRQRIVNRYLRKRYRYTILGLDDKAKECNAYLSILRYNDFRTYLDYINEVEQKNKLALYSDLASQISKIIEQNKDSELEIIEEKSKKEKLSKEEELLLLELREKKIKEVALKPLMDVTEKESKYLSKERDIQYHELIYDICTLIAPKIEGTILDVETPRELYEFYLSLDSKERKKK